MPLPGQTYQALFQFACQVQAASPSEDTPQSSATTPTEEKSFSTFMRQKHCLSGRVKTQGDEDSLTSKGGRKRPGVGTQNLSPLEPLTSVELIFAPLNMLSRAASTPLDLA